MMTTLDLVQQIQAKTQVDYSTAIDAVLTIVDLPHTDENRKFVTVPGFGAFGQDDLTLACRATRPVHPTAPHNSRVIDLDAILITCGVQRDPRRPGRPKPELVATAKHVYYAWSGTPGEAIHPVVQRYLDVMASAAYGGQTNYYHEFGPITVGENGSRETMITIHIGHDDDYHCKATARIVRYPDGTHDYECRSGIVMTLAGDDAVAYVGHTVGAVIANIYLSHAMFREFADMILNSVPWHQHAAPGLVDILTLDPDLDRRSRALATLATAAPMAVHRCAEDVLRAVLHPTDSMSAMLEYGRQWSVPIMDALTQSPSMIEYSTNTIIDLLSIPNARPEDAEKMAELIKLQILDARRLAEKLTAAGYEETGNLTKEDLIRAITIAGNGAHHDVYDDGTVVISTAAQYRVAQDIATSINTLRWDPRVLEGVYEQAGLRWTGSSGVLRTKIGVIR